MGDLKNDEAIMERALMLAEKGRFTTLPNPMVGCIIVKKGVVIGEGSHEKAGEPHAEVNALRSAGDKAVDADVYVTLEPCCHHGRTPPCVDALISAHVRRVIIAAGDPNPLVNGRGVEILRAAGITVLEGVLRAQAERQNEIFRLNKLKERPFVLYKAAMTLDGKTATTTGESKWISSTESRDLVQRWRGEYQSIAVGLQTILKDDPQLTCRASESDLKSPVKIIFDSKARTPNEAQIFGAKKAGYQYNVIIYCSESASTADVNRLRSVGAEVVTAGQGEIVDISLALKDLYKKGICSVLLEGGGTLAWSFLEAGLVDKIAWFLAPKLFGGGNAPSPFGGKGIKFISDSIKLDIDSVERIGPDLLITAYPAVI